MRFSYPGPPRSDLVETLHGRPVADPFRPLEEPDSEATRAFIEAENTLTESYLSRVSTRESIRAELRELWDYPRFGTPMHRGGRYFQWRQPGLANQPTLFVMDAPDADGRVLLDPNLLSETGTVAVTDLALSHDGELLAWAASEGGSDWRTWRIREVASALDLPDVLEWSKFTRATFDPDRGGIYFGQLDPPDAGEELTAENRAVRLVHHRLGTVPELDKVVWSVPEEPEWFPDLSITEDGRYLLLSIERGSAPESQLFVRDLAASGDAFVPIYEDFAATRRAIGNLGAALFVFSDEDAPLGRVLRVDLGADGAPSAVHEVIAERTETLLDVDLCGGELLAHYLRDASSRLVRFTPDGEEIAELAIDERCSLGGLSGRANSPEVFFETSGFTDPGTVHRLDLATGASAILHRPQTPIDPAAFVTEQVFATSADGTRVPVFLTHRREIAPTGEVPTLLYGYGGFDISLTPHYSVAWAAFVARGGLLAVANLRGGGEYGRAWHEAGMREKKQNVFDDFAACARDLVARGWTRPARLAISGGSNGGLLVGACLAQHPELFGAAVPEVGVHDMLRFHRFTIGWAWTGEYGDPDDPEAFSWLRAYSPLHNLRDGAVYPPTLVVTGENDDRVVPAHSLKFAAALQTAQGGNAPVLLRVERSAGHGMGKPTEKLIAERTDVLAFIEAALGVAELTEDAAASLRALSG